MTRQIRKRTCTHCKAFFAPDRRNVGRQQYCAQPPCRQASKAARQRRWLQKPANRDYCSGPTQVERVRQWRQDHPGYWRRTASQAREALQEAFTRQELEKHQVEESAGQPALQDSFFMQPAVLVGLIAHLTGLS
jgi:hypothetical protein